LTQSFLKNLSVEQIRLILRAWLYGMLLVTYHTVKLLQYGEYIYIYNRN
jgi:hypothetical protein